MLSYMTMARFSAAMKKDRDVWEIAVALEYWALTVFLLGAFVAGAWAGIKWLLS